MAAKGRTPLLKGVLGKTSGKGKITTVSDTYNKKTLSEISLSDRKTTASMTINTQKQKTVRTLRMQ